MPEIGSSCERRDAESYDGDLGDLLQELRVVLPGAQVLTAFLVILPFNQGFQQIQSSEKWVYVATFICSVVSLILFTAPAAQHRMERPLRDRERFKTTATGLIIAGLFPLSIALVLSTYLVIAEVVGNLPALVVAASTCLMIGGFWWLMPLRRRRAT